MVIIPISWMSWNLEDIRPGDAGGMARLGFWSPSGYEWVKVAQVMSDSLWPRGLHGPWNSLGQNTDMGSLSLLQGSSYPRDRTQVSHIAGGFFTSWATREAQECWSGQPIPSPADLPNPWIQLGSLALQVDSLLTELSGMTTPPHPSGWAKHLWSSEIQSSPETWFWRQVWCPWHWWIWTWEHGTTNLGVLLRYTDSRYAFFFF